MSGAEAASPLLPAERQKGGTMLVTAMGYASRALEEEAPPFRMGWRFQLVSEDRLAPFLNNDLSLSACENDENMLKAVRALRTYGPRSPEFKELRNPYLKGSSFTFLDIFFNGPEAYGIDEGFWYKITYDNTAVSFGNCYVPSLDESDLDIVWMKLNQLTPLDTEETEILHELYLLEPTVTELSSKNALAPATQFSAVLFCYVGAALCAGLSDTNGDIVAFFDLGCKDGSNAIPAHLRNAAQKSRRDIVNTFRQHPDIVVILSHFHDDHCNIYPYLAAIPNVVTQSQWYVPQDASPLANTINSIFHLNVYNNVWPNPGTAFTPPGFPPTLSIGKIDAVNGAPGQPKANRYCHHHGLYALVTLQSAAVPGQTVNVLLPGDSTYSGIDANVRTAPQLAVLQACHHCGEYAHAPVHRNPADIPTPSYPSNAVVCSANGITYHHPNPARLAEHTAGGWGQVKRLDRIPPPNTVLKISI